MLSLCPTPYFNRLSTFYLQIDGFDWFLKLQIPQHHVILGAQREESVIRLPPDPRLQLLHKKHLLLLEPIHEAVLANRLVLVDHDHLVILAVKGEIKDDHGLQHVLI